MQEIGFKDTGVMCVVHDISQDRFIDLGNYYTEPTGSRCLITSKQLAIHKDT